MKIVAVLGSPHGMKGNTGRLLEPLLDAVRQRGAEVQVFSLAELEVAPCRGCDVCHRTGTCHIKDDGDTIKAAMAGADSVVLASPNYVFSVSAQMKALFDRSCGAIHCRALSGKYGAAVVTAGGGGSEQVINYTGQFLLATGAWMVGGVAAEGAQLVDDARRRERVDAARELGRAPGRRHRGQGHLPRPGSPAQSLRRPHAPARYRPQRPVALRVQLLERARLAGRVAEQNPVPEKV